MLAAEGRLHLTDEVRRYQVQELATPSGETCLLELLPLPSPSTDRWIYAQHSELEVLKDRATYRSATIPRRTARLRAMIEKHQPRHVIFLGLTYLEHWDAIAETQLLVRPERPLVLSYAKTAAVAVRHPTSFGVTNDYFEDLGKALASRPKNSE